MILNPLYFKTAEEFNFFINKLYTSGMIKLEIEKGQRYLSSASYLSLARHLLKANNNQIYFLNDVKQFLDCANQEEIDASTIFFSSIKQHTISLTKIKKDPISTLNQLKWSIGPLLLIKNLNLTSLSQKPFPVLTHVDEIHRAKIMFANNKLYSTIGVIYDKIKFIKQLYEANLLNENDTKMSIPIPSRAVNFIDYFNKNILKISLIQDIKLKSNLFKQLNNFKKKNEKKLVIQWINEIDKNIIKTKKIFHLLTIFIKVQREKLDNAKEKYQQIITADPTLQKTKDQIADLLNEEKNLKRQLKKQQARFNILKPLTVYSLFVGLPVLVFSLPLIFLACVTPSMIPSTLLVFGVIFSLFGALILTTSFGNSLIEDVLNFKKNIEEKFSLDDILTKIETTKTEYEVLQSYVHFATEFSKIENELNLIDVENNDIKMSMDADLLEINTLETTEKLNNSTKQSFGSQTNDFVLFQSKKSKSEPVLPFFNQEQHKLSKIYTICK